MRTILVMFWLALTTVGFAQDLTSRQRLDRERAEFMNKRSRGEYSNTPSHVLPQNAFIKESGEIQEATSVLARFGNSGAPATRDARGGRVRATNPKLKVSALVKQFNIATQAYEDKYKYLYQHESDSSYWRIEVMKDDQGNYTDTVSREFIRYTPSLTMKMESEYKYFEKLNGKFYLVEWGKDLGYYAYESEDESGENWFFHESYSYEYEQNETTGNYFLVSKQERKRDDKGNETWDFQEIYNEAGAIVEGWKGVYEEKILANGAKEYRRDYFEYQAASGQYKQMSFWVDRYNSAGKPLRAYGLEWNSELNKLDSTSSSWSAYDVSGKHLFSIYQHTYNSANNTWQNGNRFTSEYQAGVEYLVKEWLNNGVWAKSEREAITTSVNKKDVVVAMWNNNNWSNSIKWSYEYYDSQKLKRMILYLWNGVNDWYISEYSQYRYYEYNDAGQVTRFEQYRRNDRDNTLKVLYQYDAQNRTLKVQQYNAYTNNMNSIAWDNAYETNYAYNAIGQQTNYEFKRWKDGAWMTQNKNFWIMDADGNELENKSAAYTWDTGVQQWGLHVIYTLVDGDFATVCSKPVITLSGSDTEAVQLTSSSTTGNQWFKNGEAIEGATGVSYQVSAPGIYTVQVSAGACANYADDQTIVITGIEETPGVKVKVYPNPVAHDVVVDAASWASGREFQVQVYASNGALVSTHQANASISINFSEYNKGHYILRICQGRQVVTKQIIKQ